MANHTTEFNWQDLGRDASDDETIIVEGLVPNLVVGQNVSYDHPTMSRCRPYAIITKISHAVQLDGSVTTYVDMKVL